MDMSELTIGDMINRVPEGQSQVFGATLPDAGEERFFQVWQNWDYRPGRIEWRNPPSMTNAPWFGARIAPRRSVTTLPPPDVRFKGPSGDVVDFYSTGNHAFFISDALFRLIEETDPGSLEQIAFELRAKDGTLPFHAVMPSRVLEAVDPRRTAFAIEDQRLSTTYWRSVSFPKGIVFNNEALQGVASFVDIDAHGWYWSSDLLDLAKSHGIRGLFARSVASPEGREIVRL